MLHALIGDLYTGAERSKTNETLFFKTCLEEIEDNGVHSQMYHLLQTKNKLADCPPFFIQRLKQVHDQMLPLNLYIKNQTDQLLTSLESQHIEVMPLKGVYFAEAYFGHFGARMTSDIDILIHEADYEKVKACVRNLGFSQQEADIAGHFHTSFSKSIPYSLPLTAEIHWTLVKNNAAAFDIDKFWKRSQSFRGSSSIKTLCEQDIFYFMVLHAWRHNLESTRHFLDIIQLIMTLKDQIDYTSLLEEAKEDLTFKRVIRTLSLVYQEFPFLDDVLPFPYKLNKWIWQDRGSLKTNRSNLKTYLDFMDYQFLSYDKPQYMVKEALNWFIEEKLRKSKS